MKLYSQATSPYAARVRMLLRAKGAEIEIVPPPGGIGSTEYRAINPLGKIPALVLDDGRVLPESEVICAYLDGMLDGPSLYLDDPVERAHVVLIVRLADLYLSPGLNDFFKLLFTAPGNRAAIAETLPNIARGLKYLDLYVAPSGCAAHAQFSQADCALAPLLLNVAEVLAPVIGENLLERRPNLMAYWQAIQQDPIAAPVLAEMREGLKKYQATLQAAQQSVQQQ